MRKKRESVKVLGLNVVMRLNKRVSAIKSHAKWLEKSFIDEVKRRKQMEFDREDSKELSVCFSDKAEWLFCKLMAYNSKGCGINAEEVRALLHDYNLFNGKICMEYETTKRDRLKEFNIDSSFYYNYGILTKL